MKGIGTFLGGLGLFLAGAVTGASVAATCALAYAMSDKYEHKDNRDRCYDRRRYGVYYGPRETNEQGE